MTLLSAMPWFLLPLCLVLTNQSSILATLLTLPPCRNVDSTLLLFNDKLDEYGGLYNVKEYIDRERGSARVDVSDVSKVDFSKAKKLSYYRLEQDIKSYDLVSYDEQLGRCSEENTSTWILQDYSQVVENLLTLDGSVMQTEHVHADASLVGPNALLQLVYDNADKFVLDSKGFDDVHLTSSYYFSTSTFDHGFEDEAKLIVAVQINHINVDAHNDVDNLRNFTAKIKLNTTKLSELNMLGHIASIALVSDSKRHSRSEYLAKKSAILMDFVAVRPPKLALFVVFKLIQERSQSKHAGVSEKNPLLLPSGIGCGQPVSRHRPLYVFARQFSGRFSAEDHANDYFVAYDEDSNHLRYDSFGRHKIIYALNDRLATLIKVEDEDGGLTIEHRLQAQKQTDTGQFVANGTKAASTTNASYLNRAHESAHHCAQMKLLEEETSLQNQMVGASSMGDVLGLGGPRIALMYLGYDYSLDCHVYEREILYSQIPLLMRLNIRLKPTNTGRFTMVYYFVNELDSFTQNSQMYGQRKQLHAYESMWLKRMELVSLVSLVKYTMLNARLTFSRSSWSLVIVSEESHERRAELLHPVRMFDTLECWPARGQTQLDLVLKRRERASSTSGTSKSTSSSFSSSSNQNGARVALVDSLEETLMRFLMQQIDFPRSEICDLELIVPPADDLDVDDDADDDNNGDEKMPNTMLVRSKLVKPFDHVYEKQLVGWLKSIVPILKLVHLAEVVQHKYLMNIHECALAVSTKLGGIRNQFHLLYCPRVGCAYLLGGDNALDDDRLTGYIPASKSARGTNQQQQQASPPTPESYPEMCEIQLVKRRLSTQALVTERSRPEIVRAKLERAEMVLEVYELQTDSSQQISTTLHRASVSRVSLTSGLDSNLIDDQLVKGICLTLNTKFISEIDGDERGVKVVELEFDKHRSRHHCHRACLMYEFCQTYTYSNKRHECHLSNATRSQIMDPTLIMGDTESPVDCSIHAINHVALYKRRPFVMYDTLKHLINDRSKKIFIGSLDDCANLCHENELNRRKEALNDDKRSEKPAYRCEYFTYVRMLALCVMERDIELPAALEGDSQLSAVTNSTDDDNMEPSELYQRDFLQDYSFKYGTSIQLDYPNTTSTEPVITLRNLDEFECSRECSILDRACVAFEWCSRSLSGSYERVCRLFHIRSPFTVPKCEASPSEQLLELAQQATVVINFSKLPAGSPFVRQLTMLEAEFYVENRSEGFKIGLKGQQSCSHYYLNGDNLYLKRALNAAKRNYDQHKEETVIELMTGEMLEKSNLHIETSQTTRADKLNHQTGSSNSFVTVLFQLSLGAMIGSFVFVLQFKMAPKTLSNHSHEFLNPIKLRNLFQLQNIPRRERSMSRVEITEMMDLDEDETTSCDNNSRRQPADLS